MPKSFLPANDALLLLWVTNYRKNIQELAPELGLTTKELKEELGICDGLIDTISFVNSKKAQLSAAIKNRDTAIRKEGKKLHAILEGQRVHPAFTKEMGELLGLSAAH